MKLAALSGSSCPQCRTPHVARPCPNLWQTVLDQNRVRDRENAGPIYRIRTQSPKVFLDAPPPNMVLTPNLVWSDSTTTLWCRPTVGSWGH